MKHQTRLNILVFSILLSNLFCYSQTNNLEYIFKTEERILISELGEIVDHALAKNHFKIEKSFIFSFILIPSRNGNIGWVFYDDTEFIDLGRDLALRLLSEITYECAKCDSISFPVDYFNIIFRYSQENPKLIISFDFLDDNPIFYQPTSVPLGLPNKE